MADEQKNTSVTAAVVAAIATIVIVGGSAIAFVNWAVPKAQDYADTKFAAIDAKIAAIESKVDKIDKNNKNTMDALTKLPSLADTAKEIGTLNSRIEKTNATLSDIQKQISLGAMKKELAPLDGKLDKANAALAAIQGELARAKPDQALARVEKAVNTVGDKITGAASAADLQDAAAKLASARDMLAKLQDSFAELAKMRDSVAQLNDLRAPLAKIEKAAATIETGVAAGASTLNANAAALAETHKSLAALHTAVKDGFAAGTASRSALTNEVARLAQQPSEPATTATVKNAGENLVVLYVSTPADGAGTQPPRAGMIPPMSVQYEKVGGTDDEGQTALIVGKLRPVLAKHHGCSIAVSGHTDTVGSDDVNHAISKRRALAVAAKLKAAFAGVPISNTAWGERKLKEWTDDETPDATNRRVDIVVRCTG
jgi:flagellar motor protein MotB